MLKSLNVDKHPDKTWLGQARRGFDFLGFRITPTTSSQPSAASVSRRDNKVTRLYEQGASKQRVGLYLRRWLGWAVVGCVTGATTPVLGDVGFITKTGTNPNAEVDDVSRLYVWFNGMTNVTDSSGKRRFYDTYHEDYLSSGVDFVFWLPAGKATWARHAKINIEDKFDVDTPAHTATCPGANVVTDDGSTSHFTSILLPENASGSCVLSVYWTTAAGVHVSFTGATLYRDSTGTYSIDGNGVLKGEDAGGTADLPPTTRFQPQTLQIDPDTAGDKTLSLHIGNDIDLTNRAVTIEGPNASDFTEPTAGYGCDSSMTAGSSCDLSVTYTKPSTVPEAGISALVSLKNSAGDLISTAAIMSHEGDANEAARRIPDVISDLTIPALTAGSAATISWSQTGYQSDLKTMVYAFECTASNGPVSAGGDGTCGEDPSTSTNTPTALTGTVVTAANSWRLGTAQAKQRDFTWSYTPTSSGTVVLRFFTGSTMDIEAGNDAISLLVPGGLAGAGSAFNHFDTVGRRISATVNAVTP